MTSVKIITDSTNKFGHRITTFELVFPRFLLPELATHRVFSKNSSSSRAVPFEKMVESVVTNPFLPLAWQKAHSGMQGTEYFTGWRAKVLNMAWLVALNTAVFAATKLYKLGLTKQLANRLIEPFSYIKVLLTATEYDNFFSLRCSQYEVEIEGFGLQRFKSKRDLLNAVHKSQLEDFDKFTTVDWLKINKGMAEIHLMDLAEKMWDALKSSVPEFLEEGQYHIPYKEKISDVDILAYVDNYNSAENQDGLLLKTKLRISTMMCARTSYTVPTKEQAEWTIPKYIAKFQEMAGNGHWSPMEHCSQNMTSEEYENDFTRGDQVFDVDGNPNYSNTYGWCNNFRGFKQLRWMMEHNKISL